MPVYAYKGVNAAGRSLKGFVDADSDKGARSKLRRDGIFLTELAESGEASPAQRRSAGGRALRPPRGVSDTDRAIATRQLATLLSAAVPLVEALGALTEQVENPRLKAALGGVRDRVNEGASLADAMAGVGAFSDLYVNLVRAGETSGALDAVLARLADYLESQVRTRNRVSGILIYPAIVLVFAVIVVAVLVTYVLPKVTELLAQSQQELPFATKVILSGSAFFTSYWWLIALLCAAVFVSLRSLGRTERGRYALDGIKLRLPVFGKLLRTLAIARFARTLTTLLSGGIPIVRSLDTAGRVAGNAVIAEAVDNAKDSITEGSSIAAPLRASGQFPPLVTHMVSVGERSGELEAMLAKVADAYDEQVEITLSRLTALLQPILMIVLVAIVAFIIVATLLPLLNLAGSLQQV